MLVILHIFVASFEDGRKGNLWWIAWPAVKQSTTNERDAGKA
jgi:hypothetical protein